MHMQHKAPIKLASEEEVRRVLAANECLLALFCLLMHELLFTLQHGKLPFPCMLEEV